MPAAAHKREFDVLLVWAADRLARSVRHFLEVLDTLNHLGIEFVSFPENLDTGRPLGRAVVVIVSAVAELERNLMIERVCAGLKRAKLEGRQLGRRPIEIDRAALLRDRARGLESAIGTIRIAEPAWDQRTRHVGQADSSPPSSLRPLRRRRSKT